MLDLTKVLAGPLCTQTLADMGAEVIKIETLGGGDETRHWPPMVGGEGAVFMSVNRNKRSITVDLKTAEGRAIVRDLAKSADVAIESFGTGVVERLGCDAATLMGLNPRLIYCSISGYGRQGPLAKAPGYDVILQAFTGIMSMTGDEGGGHIRSPISPIDQATGQNALIGILAALFGRQTSGLGTLVEVSLFDTAVSLLGYNLQTYWQRQTVPAKAGSSHESLCPYQAFEASDGPVLIGVANDNLWRKFCRVAGLGEIADDQRFATNPARVAHRAETLNHVQAAISGHSVEFWFDALLAVGVPCAPINTLAQLLAHPHTQASGMILNYQHGILGAFNAVAQPVRLNGSRSDVSRPPPGLGEHTDAVLAELGYSAAAILALREAAVVA